MASETSGAAVDTAEGRRLYEKSHGDGPWKYDPFEASVTTPKYVIGDAVGESDGRLIEWMHANLPALLSSSERVAELEARVRELEAAIGGLVGEYWEDHLGCGFRSDANEIVGRLRAALSGGGDQ